MISQPFTLFFSLKVQFRWKNYHLVGRPHTCSYCDEGFNALYSTRIELFYFDDDFRHIALWVSALRLHPQRWIDIESSILV